MASCCARICTGVLCALVLAVAKSGALGQDDPNGTWSTLSPAGAGPGALNQHGVIYDPIGDRMIVFGGAESLQDTWMLSLGAPPQWTNLNASIPGGRKAMAVIYDPVRHRLIMFGGYSDTYKNDVWALDLQGNAAWTELHPTGGSPSGRMFTLAVYDPLRDRMIMFGGHPDALNDVWALSLAQPAWTQLNPAGTPPSPRYGHVGIYDPVGDRLVIFGGTSGGDQSWALSLSGTPGWTQLAIVGPRPPERSYATAVYDPRGRRMVVYGGVGGPVLGDAWALTLDGTESWQQLTPDGVPPAARHLHGAVYQQSTNRMVVFGGVGGGSEVPVLQWASTPVITGFSPAGGRIGDAVQVFGSSLHNVTDVAFSGIPAPIVEISATRILTSVPVGAATGSIAVTNPSGTSMSEDSFFVGETPEIGSAMPESGKVGATVTISGAHLGGATRVAFGPQSHASFIVDSDQQITAIVDALAHTGPISVATPAATGTSSFSFEVLPFDTAARIVNVRDVRADQGGLVAVRWLRSDLDAVPRREIAGYRVWRRAPSDLVAAGATRPTWRREVTLAGEVEYWEPLTVVPASYLDGYAFVAPTTRDSIGGSNPYTAFFIQTLTADAFVFYNSVVDSGYSVDNLAPPVPMPFTATYSGSSNALHWTTSRAPDLREFRLHRGSAANFVPGPSNLVVASRDTGYVDAPGSFYYKLAAVDVHGNLSRYALVSPDVPTATLASLVSMDAQHDRVRLVWYTPDGPGVAAVVYRRTVDTDWTLVDRITPDGNGYLRYEDAAVTSGARYGYQLGIMDAGEEIFAGEVWAEVPALQLAMRGATPNPAVGGRLRVEFALRDGSPARLELADVAGRVLSTRQVGSLGPGTHGLDLAEGGALRPGIYFLRLTQGGSEVQARAAVIR